jgi:hypothetical protein
MFFNGYLLFSLFFVSGVLPDMEFLLANNVYQAGRTTGVLHGIDFLGKWIIGEIADGIILLPILGLSDGCITLIILKLSSLILLLTSYKK